MDRNKIIVLGLVLLSIFAISIKVYKEYKNKNDKETIPSMKIEEMPNYGKSRDYINRAENTELVFRNEKNGTIEKRFNMFVENNKIQQVILTDENIIKGQSKITIEDGKVTKGIIESSKDKYKNRLNIDLEEEIILKDPITLGNKWKNKEITGVDLLLNTPLGEFKAIEVTKTMDNVVEKSYYTKDIGLIKKIKETNSSVKSVTDKEEILVITQYNENKKMLVEFDSYYYEVVEDVTGVKKEVIKLSTNGDIVKELEKEMNKIKVDGEEIEFLTVGTSGCKINSIEVDEDENYLHMDIDNFLPFKYGNGGEYMAVQVLVNTMIKFYDVEYITITSNGNEINSGHGSGIGKLYYNDLQN